VNPDSFVVVLDQLVEISIKLVQTSIKDPGIAEESLRSAATPAAHPSGT
jgi:hypothetical protein